jgi:hypothetical protein
VFPVEEDEPKGKEPEEEIPHHPHCHEHEIDCPHALLAIRSRIFRS